MRHYLLDPEEAELLAYYRMLSADMKIAVIALITSQSSYTCHKLDKRVEIKLVD